MPKRIVIFLFTILLSMALAAQKHDNIWLFGYDTGGSLGGGFALDFSNGTPETYRQNHAFDFDLTAAVMCDAEGELLFYTNGIAVADATHHKMMNGDSINFGWNWLDFRAGGYRIPQGAVALPMPANEDVFYLLHLFFEASIHPPYYYLSDMLYTTIYMQSGGGRGEVIEKNERIIIDTLEGAGLTAVRHGNGRDWWIVVPKYDSNTFFRVLLSPAGLTMEGQQQIGLPIKSQQGAITFTPDGSRYIRNAPGHWVEDDVLSIFDFDRCTGMLSNPRQFVYADTAGYSTGVAVSPNSRYLYVPHRTEVFQFDLEAEDIQASQTVVAEWDSTYSPYYPLATRFAFAQLGPDGRIYINSPNTVDKMHVIEYPDRPGELCEVRQHAIDLPALNKFTMPHFPNYRLYDWHGSPCDTLDIDGPPEPVVVSEAEKTASGVLLFPNPALDFVTIYHDFPVENAILSILDVMGREVLRLSMKGKMEENINLTAFPKGMYFYRLSDGVHLLASGKFLKL